MTTDKRFSKKPLTVGNPAAVTGSPRMDPGPYIGIVKANADSGRSGRLQVFIPDIGGLEDEPSHWKTVSYASPFFGSTNYSNRSQNSDNRWDNVSHTYGMWFTPPDIGAQVLVTFVMGNPAKGYWFACINPTVSHHAMPGIAASPNIDKTFLSADLASVLTGSSYPVTEFNEHDLKTWSKRSRLDTVPKPIHEPQVRILLEQGLQDDTVRGTTTSSSQRESPSFVFGVSTPGRDSGNAADLNKTNSPKFRLGGHQFVMDDGDANGNNQLVRLRTAGGHQIILHDTAGVVYISNSTGSAWMEFTNDGKMHFYSGGSFDVRAQGDLNLHSDSDVNINAGGNINMYATNTMNQQAQTVNTTGTTDLNQTGGTVEVSAGSTLGLTAGTTGSWSAGNELLLSGKSQISVASTGALVLSALTSGSFNGGSDLILSGGVLSINGAPAPIGSPAPVVSGPPPLTQTNFADAEKTGLLWTSTGSAQSIVTSLPTHEPWTTEHFYNNSGSSNTTAPTQGVPADTTAQLPGPASTIGKGVTDPVTPSMLNAQPIAVAVSPLTAVETTALSAQCAMPTGGNYSAMSPTGLGKYNIDPATLANQGFLANPTANITDPNSWTGKNGVTSATSFLQSPAIQEKSFSDKLSSLSSSLSSSGLINPTTTATTAAGLLCAANSSGLGAVTKWVSSGIDPGGIGKLFNQGRFSVTAYVGQALHNIEAKLKSDVASVFKGKATSLAASSLPGIVSKL